MKQIRGGVVVSSAALIVAVLAGSPAFAAKSGSKAAKAPSEPFEKRFAVFYGNKSLNKTDWEPVEKQTGYGVEAEIWKSDWPASALITYFAGDGSGSITNIDIDGDGLADADADITGETTEIGIGARKWLEGGDAFTLFVEAGAVSISGKLNITLTNTATPGKVSDSGSGTGFWIGGGLSYPVSDTLSVGAIARMSQGEVKLFGTSGEGGGTILMLTLQYYSEE